MLRNILYASDLGLFGPYLLEHVCELAFRHQARVTVIHAVEPVSVFAGALLETYVPQKDKKALKQHGYQAVMATIRARVRQAFEEDFIDFQGPLDCIAGVEVQEGDAWQVILDTAERTGADLIVMGSRSGHQSRGTTIGSVASKVLQLSPVPVYLVPVDTVQRNPEATLRRTRT
ncbi:MAG: universal stress protein [Pseudomonadota bacterium]|nr:universal stress protein UspA [Pseudomonadales bacterium]MDY6919933.1 universal stress protein [Pseudomonadota bacterium]